MANITMTGRLGKDPVLKRTRDGGKTYAVTSIGWRERQMLENSYVDGPTVWVQVKAFGYAAKQLMELEKGELAVFTGMLSPETWNEDDEHPVLVLIPSFVSRFLFPGDRDSTSGSRPRAEDKKPRKAVASDEFYEPTGEDFYTEDMEEIEAAEQLERNSRKPRRAARGRRVSRRAA